MEGADTLESLETLEWDTNFFGFPVARIVNPNASIDELRAVRDQMNERQIPLAYWSAENPNDDIRREAERLGARLVDERLTFVSDLRGFPRADIPELRFVQSYIEGMSLTELKQLAVDSGIYSRFVVDPQFPRAKAIALFEEWIERSIEKTFADDVLVLTQDHRIAGMATIRKKNDCANIGLAAVAADFRRRRFGQALVYAAQNWCRERGVDRIEVATQSVNVPARMLYRKCGFQLQRTEFVFHFWSEPFTGVSIEQETA